jgi:hypothetical protein
VSQPSHGQLRALAGCGAALVVVGALLGWFERSHAAAVAGEVVVLRPDDMLGLGVVGWLVLVPFALAPLTPWGRRAARVAAVVVLPGVALVLAAVAMPPRAAVSGETIDDFVVARTLGQALSLVGALVALMALTAAWRRAPDWRVPFEWSRTAADQ